MGFTCCKVTAFKSHYGDRCQASIELYGCWLLVQAEERRSARMGRDDDRRAEEEELRQQEEKRKKKKRTKASSGLVM